MGTSNSKASGNSPFDYILFSAKLRVLHNRAREYALQKQHELWESERRKEHKDRRKRLAERKARKVRKAADAYTLSVNFCPRCGQKPEQKDKFCGSCRAIFQEHVPRGQQVTYVVDRFQPASSLPCTSDDLLPDGDF